MRIHKKCVKLISSYTVKSHLHVTNNENHHLLTDTAYCLWHSFWLNVIYNALLTWLMCLLFYIAYAILHVCQSKPTVHLYVVSKWVEIIATITDLYTVKMVCYAYDYTLWCSISRFYSNTVVLPWHLWCNHNTALL